MTRGWRGQQIFRVGRVAAIAILVAIWPTEARQSADPEGWQEAKWGMPLEEVHRILPQLTFSAPYEGDVRIPETGAIARCGQAVKLTGFVLFDLAVPVELCFGRNDRLYRVKISSGPDRGSGSSVLDALRAKYGMTTRNSETNFGAVRVLEYEWQLPKTLIKFGRIIEAGSLRRGPNTSYLLTYEDANQLRQGV